MSSPLTAKSPCATCGKSAGIFTCHGCAKDFCTRHVAEHRQVLGIQLDEVLLEHDQLRQKLIEFTNNPREHPLMKKVDEWEQISIDKIRQWADDARQQIASVIRFTNGMPNDFNLLGKDLTNAHQNDDFVETDLKIWLERLEQLKKRFIEPDIIQPLQDDNGKLFISKIIINKEETIDIFAESAGCTRIEDYGKVIVHDERYNHGSVRGKGQYSFGQHKFNFRFEQFHPTNWGFFGIISKHSPIRATSWNTPTAYGWTTNWNVTRNGNQDTKAAITKQNIEINDILELLIDCDQRTIRLTHERTSTSHQIDIDITLCPFPWQIFLGLYSSVGDCIRLL